MDEKKKMRMTLCVDEAAANIIEHSEPNGDSKPYFKMIAQWKDDFLKVTFSDKGKPFDPTKAPVVDIKKHVRSGNRGGLGVHIMRNSLDLFEYERLEGQNVFTLGMICS
jgi:anti-sigma regulatory factor (Ser/Thr protein kinase)